MKFHYVGHACVGVEAEHFILLLDPWFGDPINMNQMSPYPPYGKPDNEFLKRVGAIHISHMHQDHLNFGSLSHFPMGTPIYIGNYKEPEFRQKLMQWGRSPVRLIPNHAGIKVGPFCLYSFFQQENDGSFDSLLVLEYQGRHFFFNNDCILLDSQYEEIRNQFGNFEGGFLGYTYVSPYPTCFDFAWTNVEEIENERIQTRFSQIENLIGFLNFKWIVPYASGMRFFNSSLLEHNRSFINPADLISKFSVPVFILEPGQIWNPGEATNPQFGYSSESVKEWLQKNNQIIPAPENLPLLNPEVYRRYFQNYLLAVSKNWAEAACVQIKIEGEDGSLDCYFDSKVGQLYLGKKDDPDMILSLPSYALNPVMAGKASMRMLYYSFLFQVTVNRSIGSQSRPETWW